ncbi:MAG: arsenate reductase (glutaredoxin) [Bdellovibrionota bacterium]
MKAKIFHNPRCSKSRQTLALLEEKNMDVEVVEYLKTPPTQKELSAIVDMLGISPWDLVRKNESILKELNLDGTKPAKVLKAMTEHPILIERPIVVIGKKAAIGRPPENILSIL